MEIGKTFNPYGLFVGSFIPNCILQEKLLSSTAKLCYARLCQYSGKNGVAFPKQETLAKEIGISEVQVIRVLKNLEDFGLIKRIKATGQDKFLHKTNRYTFLWHKIYEQDDSSVANADDSSVANADDSSKRIKVLRESDEIEEEKKEHIGDTKTVAVSKKIDFSKKQEKDYNARDLVAYFGKKFEETIGWEYHANFGKDGKIMKDLATHYKPEGVLDLIEEFFDMAKENEWVADKLEIGVFKSVVNKLLIRMKKEKK